MTATVEIFAEMIHETEDAYLIETPEKKRVWVPKSQCEWDGRCTFMTSEWFAEKKDLL